MARFSRIPSSAIRVALALGSAGAWAAGCADATEGAPDESDASVLDGAPSSRGEAGESSDAHTADAHTSDASTPDADASDADASDANVPADAGDAGDAGDADAAPPAIDVYDPGEVKTYGLTFDGAAMAILSSTNPADDKTWVHGDFAYGGVTIANVGVRRKGSSTFRALPKKAALKIKFDKYVDGQKFAGLKELTLNNSLSDPTFIAERLSYHVFRSVGLPAQRAASARITINGDVYGVYTNVETPNKDFIRRVFGNAVAKTLYEVNSGSEWLPGYEDGFEEEVGDGTASDVTALFQSVQAAQSATLLADVSGRLDTTEFLRFVATEAAVGHYDGYAFGVWGSHNYFMAGNVNGVFSLIPWSTDLTMSDRMTVVNANTPLGTNTLIVRCKASSTCWNEYKNQMKSVLTAYETLDLVTLAHTWHAQVDALVLADPKREDPVNYYNDSTTLLYTWLAQRPGVIRGQLGITP